MRLDEVQKLWEKDSQIDQANLGAEATRNPQLYSKYLNLLSNSRLLVRKAQGDYLDLRKRKLRYYRGEMTKPELDAYQWKQYLGKTLLKSEMDDVLKMDRDLRVLEDKLEYHTVIQLFLEGVVKSLATRGWEIKSAIEWYKIQQGLM